MCGVCGKNSLWSGRLELRAVSQRSNNISVVVEDIFQVVVAVIEVTRVLAGIREGLGPKIVSFGVDADWT